MRHPVDSMTAGGGFFSYLFVCFIVLGSLWFDTLDASDNIYEMEVDFEYANSLKRQATVRNEMTEHACSARSQLW